MGPYKREPEEVLSQPHRIGSHMKTRAVIGEIQSQAGMCWWTFKARRDKEWVPPWAFWGTWTSAASSWDFWSPKF